MTQAVHAETPDLYGAFPRLSDDQLGRLAEAGETREVRPSELLFTAGQPCSEFFAIVSGHVAIVDRHGPEERIVRVHGPGRFLGEVSLLTGQVAFLSAMALEAGTVVAVDQAALRRVMAEDPLFGDLVLRAYLIRRTLLVGSGGSMLVIGSRYSPDTRRLREFIGRNRIPHRFLDVEDDPIAEALLREHGVPPGKTPVVIWNGEQVLLNPDNHEVAELIGLRRPGPPEMTADVLILGAGPAGLAAAVYAASEGLLTVVAEAVAAGGQAGTSSRIENYLGFPAGISGAELTERAVLQAGKFGARTGIPARARTLARHGGHYLVRFDDGAAVVARSVVIATGVRYRRLDVPRMDEFERTSVYYAATEVEATMCGPDPVVVVGGGNSAGQAALFLSQRSPTVNLVVREPELGQHMSRYLVDQIVGHPRIVLATGSELCGLVGESVLEAVVIRNRDTGATRVVDARAVFVFIGADPHTGWLNDVVDRDDHGYLLTGDRAHTGDPRHAGDGAAPMLLETSLPGVFAAGDARSGSVKRVATAVGDGAMAVRFVHEHLLRLGVVPG